MQLPKRALQRLNFAFVFNLLSLGQLKSFQHFLHLIESVLQFINDLGNLFNGPGDSGTFWSCGDGAMTSLNFRVAERGGGFGRHRLASWFRGRNSSIVPGFRRGSLSRRRARTASARMASTAATRSAKSFGRGRLSLIRNRLLLFVRNHATNLPG